ncbi:acyl-coenzyme A thioesterase-like protein 13 [Dipodascopsis uninucleata]
MLPFVRGVWSSFLSTSGLEPALIPRLKLLSAAPGRVEMSLQIEKDHTNRLGILHGGLIASVVDLGGSLAVASHGLFATGVSTDLNVSYISSGGKIGSEIKILASCDRIGKTLAFTSINFYTLDDVLFARGSHTKYIAAAMKDLNNLEGAPLKK